MDGLISTEFINKFVQMKSLTPIRGEIITKILAYSADSSLLDLLPQENISKFCFSKASTGPQELKFTDGSGIISADSS
jgi:hypothetical protein